jgi:predicted ester cyclase
MSRPDQARRALEQVCSGRELDAIEEVYSPQFVDHVNDFEYHGINGARRSVALYRQLFPDLRFHVEAQLSDEQGVVSRWTLTGTHRGRPVKLWGIVISKFDDNDKIVEDWAASDTLSLIRQLGLWRSTLLLLTHRKHLHTKTTTDRR